MSDFSDKFRRFMRKDTVLFVTIPFMAMLNVLTNIVTDKLLGFTFPWSLIAIGGIIIAIFDDFAKIFLADGPNASKKQALEASAAASTDQSLDQSLAAQLAQVRRYKQDIDQLAKTSRGERLRGVAAQFDNWVDAIERMSARVNSFRQNAAIQQDLRTVPQSISKLEAQLTVEKDERVRAQLQNTLAMRRSQLASLEKLQGTMRAAEIQLESTIASLGIIYSQALVSQSTNQIADYSHLAADAQEQTRVLNDYLETLEEVKLGREATALSPASNR